MTDTPDVSDEAVDRWVSATRRHGEDHLAEMLIALKAERATRDARIKALEELLEAASEIIDETARHKADEDVLARIDAALKG